MSSAKNFINFKPIWIGFLMVLSFIFLSPQASADHTPITGARSDTFPDTSIGDEADTFAVVQIVDQPIKMKARSTLANIYIPNSLLGTEQTIRIIDGCDWAGRDYGGGNGSTDFYVVGSGFSVFANNDLVCGSGDDIDLVFTPTAQNSIQATEDYQLYQFRANGNGREQPGFRYLNAFRVRALGANALVGISNTVTACNTTAYPWSCPSNRPAGSPVCPNDSCVYSSFYGGLPSGQDYYGQEIIIEPCSSGATRTGGFISLYDLDANNEGGPSSLDQNIRIRLYKDGVRQTLIRPDNSTTDEIDHSSVKLWGFAYPGYGGNEDEYMDLPPDDRNASLGTFDPSSRYRFEILGLSKDNAIQMMTSLTPCPEANDDPPISCTITLPGSGGDLVASARRFNVNVTIRNEGSRNIRFRPASTDDIATLGLIDPSSNHAKEGQHSPPGTTVGVNTTPDTTTRFRNIAARDETNMDPFTDSRDNRSKNRITSDTNVNLAPGATRLFRISLQALSSNGEHSFGFRLLDRDRPSNPWAPYDDSCTKTVTIVSPPTCSVGDVFAYAGEEFTSTALLDNPNNLRVEVENANYKINSPSPRDTDVTLNGNNPNRNYIASNVQDQEYESDGEIVTTPDDYDIDWTITTNVAGAKNTVCSSTLTVVRPPIIPDAACNSAVSISSIDPLNTFNVDLRIDLRGTSWSNGSNTGGLHIGVGLEGQTNWDANWTVANPPPDNDATQDFSVLGNGGGQNPVNLTRYNESTASVGHRYYVNNPSNSDIRLRLGAPSETGNYTIVVRLYDKGRNLWFPSRCEIDMPVELRPLSCSVSFDPIALFEVNRPFASTLTVQNPNLVSVPLDSVEYSTDAPGIDDGSFNNVTVPAKPPGGLNGSESRTASNLRTDTAGDYTFTWDIAYRLNQDVAASLNNCNGVGAGESTDFSQQFFPYAKFYGNDIFAGGGFGQGCSLTDATATPSAIAWMGTNPDSPENTYLQGASAELAIFAVNVIQGISPGSALPFNGTGPGGTITGGDLDTLTRLAFANSGVDAGGNAINTNTGTYNFGGGFGQTVCSEDWWADRDGDPITDVKILGAAVPSNSLNLDSDGLNGSRGSYIVSESDLSSAPLRLQAGAPIEDGTRLTIYVEGDVVIEDTISNANTNWDNSGGVNAAEKIPALFIIAQGNIYISSGVDQLDGVFVAQPDEADPTSVAEEGQIHTCYSPSLGNLITAYNNDPNSAASKYLVDECGSKLTINGAFVAKTIELLRTNGTVSLAEENEDPFDSSNENVGEVFRFNPLLYIVGGDGVPETNRQLDKVPTFESILSLPPIF